MIDRHNRKSGTVGRQSSSFSNWKICRNGISSTLFKDIVKFDASAPRDLEVWRKVRKCYKSVVDPWALENELPDTFMGLLLLMMIKQVICTTCGFGRHDLNTSRDVLTDNFLILCIDSVKKNFKKEPKEARGRTSAVEQTQGLIRGSEKPENESRRNGENTNNIC